MVRTGGRLAEALFLGRAGLDLGVVRETLTQSAADSRFIRQDLDALFVGDFMRSFDLDRCYEELKTGTWLFAVSTRDLVPAAGTRPQLAVATLAGPLGNVGLGNEAEAVLHREFDADALPGLREAVLSCATACGMPGDRAIEVMLAVHELAASAVRHGPGHGRLRIHLTASTLHCEVSDPGSSSRDDRGPGGSGGRASGALAVMPWPVEQGHGL